VIRPLERSYGVTSRSTLSPGRTRILWRRILPERCPRITWPESNWTRKTVL